MKAFRFSQCGDQKRLAEKKTSQKKSDRVSEGKEVAVN